MSQFLLNLFNTDGFPPRWHCGTGWTSGHGWLHIISDFAIFAAYAMIPVVLVFFIAKRRDIPFPSVMLLFAAFILSCGCGHFIEATIFWYPWYRFSAVVKLFTAIISWVTVFALVPIVPKLLSLPGLESVNDQLRSEIERRKKIEAIRSSELEQMESLNDQLQKFNDLGVERELRMLELKREVNKLSRALGEGVRYKISYDQKHVVGHS